MQAAWEALREHEWVGSWLRTAYERQNACSAPENAFQKHSAYSAHESTPPLGSVVDSQPNTLSWADYEPDRSFGDPPGKSQIDCPGHGVVDQCATP